MSAISHKRTYSRRVFAATMAGSHDLILLRSPSRAPHTKARIDTEKPSESDSVLKQAISVP